MAKVFPDGWRELEASGAAGREIQTLHRLAAGLDDRYSVYHGVHWTRIQEDHFAIVGEVDFAILGPTGKVLLIEQKTGILTETPTGLVKKFADKHKNVAIHLARTAEALRERLRRTCDTDAIELDTLLYCPDHTVREPGSAGIDPARIVDAKRRDELHAVIRAILPPDGEPIAPRAGSTAFSATSCSSSRRCTPSWARPAPSPRASPAVSPTGRAGSSSSPSACA